MSDETINSIVLVLVGFVSSTLATLLGYQIKIWYNDFKTVKPLKKILNFGPGNVVFIYPSRDEPKHPDHLLPMTSTEDFMAMNNIISALVKINWHSKYHFCTPESFKPELAKETNLVYVCSPKSNDMSEQLQEDLKKMGLEIPYFDDDSDGIWKIFEKNGDIHPSQSYDQYEAFRKSGVSEEELPAKEFDDKAIVVKISRPDNPKYKILWVAGIRGIGTWGAAEAVKKRYDLIYDNLKKDKTRDFAILLDIKYENFDITGIDKNRLFEL